MLANIASIEIPALPQRLSDWLRGATDERLAAPGIAREDINDRAFYPRLALGEYLSAQFWALVHRGRSLGIEIEVRAQSTVTDVRITGEHRQETGAAGYAGLSVLLQDAELAQAVELDRESRVLVINTEGATAPALYKKCGGDAAEAVLARQSHWRTRASGR